MEKILFSFVLVLAIIYIARHVSMQGAIEVAMRCGLVRISRVGTHIR